MIGPCPIKHHFSQRNSGLRFVFILFKAIKAEHAFNPFSKV